MDKSSQESYIARLEAQKVEALRQHVAAFELLEAEHGLDIDALTDIYSLTLLNPDVIAAKEELKFWQSLYEAINSNHKYLALIGQRIQRIPDTTRVKHISVYTVSIFDQSLKDSAIWTHRKDGNGPIIVMSGDTSYFTMEDLTAKSDAPIVLAEPITIDWTGLTSKKRWSVVSNDNPVALVRNIDRLIYVNPAIPRNIESPKSSVMADWAMNEVLVQTRGGSNG